MRPGPKKINIIKIIKNEVMFQVLQDVNVKMMFCFHEKGKISIKMNLLPQKRINYGSTSSSVSDNCLVLSLVYLFLPLSNASDMSMEYFILMKGY